METTPISEKENKARAKKMMLWFGIVSLLMAFAGWTSAYIVSSSREDWDASIELPPAFFLSTGVILLSSITYYLAKRAIQRNSSKDSLRWLWVTMALGILFVGLQFVGFSQMVAQGYYFTGPTSTIKMSYIFLIAAVHVVHVVAGMISLAVVLYRQAKGYYSADDYLGLSLGETFWHFLDLLWVYLVGFMYLVG